MTITISKEAHQVITTIADTEGISVEGVIDKAVENYRRESLLRQTNKAFAVLRNDPSGWEDEQRERNDWNITLNDGLDDEA